MTTQEILDRAQTQLVKNAKIIHKCDRYLKWFSWFPMAYEIRDSRSKLLVADKSLRDELDRLTEAQKRLDYILDRLTEAQKETGLYQ
jgi:hypothetical protein